VSDMSILGASLPLYMPPSDIPNVRRLAEVVRAGDAALRAAVTIQRDRWAALGRVLLESIDYYPRNSDARSQWLKDTGLHEIDVHDRSAAVWFYENRTRLERDGIGAGLTHPRRLRGLDSQRRQLEMGTVPNSTKPAVEVPTLRPAADGVLEPASTAPPAPNKYRLRAVKFEHRKRINAVVAAVRKQIPHDIDLQIQIASAALDVLKAARETELSIDRP
jgi:hypothetical protein